MSSVQKAIFPGIAIGCLFLVLATSLIASPKMALASQPLVAAAAAGEAAMFFNGQVGADPTPQPVADTLANQQAVGESAQENTTCSISATYPNSIQQWCGWISQYASQYQVDPNLVAAVMVQESGGNADAYSKSGAVGLLQVMPRDGLASSFMCINGPCFADRPSSDQLFDPQFNIEYGSRMLAGLIQRHGNVRDALKAYGPMNMGYRYADLVLNIFNQHQ